MKHMILILAASLAGSAHASTRVNNGMLDPNLIYACEEENPADPQNPYISVLRETSEGSLLIVKKKQSVDIEYTGIVTPKANIRCIVACDIRENREDNVGFGVTTLGSYQQGLYSSPSQKIVFNCKQFER